MELDPAQVALLERISFLLTSLLGVEENDIEIKDGFLKFKLKGIPILVTPVNGLDAQIETAYMALPQRGDSDSILKWLKEVFSRKYAGASIELSDSQDFLIVRATARIPDSSIENFYQLLYRLSSVLLYYDCYGYDETRRKFIEDETENGEK